MRNHVIDRNWRRGDHSIQGLSAAAHWPARVTASAIDRALRMSNTHPLNKIEKTKITYFGEEFMTLQGFHASPRDSVSDCLLSGLARTCTL